jgi:hypothetical protein
MVLLTGEPPLLGTRGDRFTGRVLDKQIEVVNE